MQVLGKGFVGCGKGLWAAEVFIKALRERKLAHSFPLVQCWKTPDKFLVPKQGYHESQYFFLSKNMCFTGADELDGSLQSFIIVFSFLSPSPFPFSNLKVPNGRMRFWKPTNLCVDFFVSFVSLRDPEFYLLRSYLDDWRMGRKEDSTKVKMHSLHQLFLVIIKYEKFQTDFKDIITERK